MKKSMLILFSIWSITLLANGDPGDKTDSPYFDIRTPSVEVGGFPLQMSTADVSITGPIAHVTVTQTYTNLSNVPIEGMYVFPGSTRAAVHHMEMVIGDRTIVAEIMQKDEARNTYETAKKEGKRAGLLSQDRPNIFQMEVANILPGESVQVVMKYTEYLVPTDQVYTFAYPTVVGPRYVSKAEQQPVVVTVANRKTGQQYSDKPGYQFGMNIDLQTPVPISHLLSCSHLIKTEKVTESQYAIGLDPSEMDGGNRDFILEFSLNSGHVETGVLTYTNGDEHFFLCQVEAPERTRMIEPLAREYIFVLDVSGSMHGFPLDLSKNLMQNLLTELTPRDRFNVVLFSGRTAMLYNESQPAVPENISHALEQFLQIQGAGGTELLAGLERAMSIPKAPGCSRTFVIATDGYITVEEATFKYIERNLGKANFFAFGIGTSVNRFLIEGIAHVGRGEPFIVTNQESALEMAHKLQRYIQYPAMTDIRLTSSDWAFYDLMPENIPDLLAERPIYCFGKYTPSEGQQITLTGQIGDTEYSRTLALPDPKQNNSALQYLWAREAIRYLSDFNTANLTDERINQITDLGLKYNLLTKYTSFVAVDDQEIVTNGEDPQKVQQVIPLPQGVSPLAIGFEMSFAPMVAGVPVLTVDIDVESDNDTLESVIDPILELIFKSWTAESITEHLGKEFTLTVKSDGGVHFKSGDQKLADLIVKEIEANLKILGYAPAAQEEVIIRITQTSSK